MTHDDLTELRETFNTIRDEEMSLTEYLNRAREDSTLYASPAERMLRAIGDPRLVNTSKDPRLGRIFFNRTIKLYEPFTDFFGMEEVIEQVVGFFRHAEQGLEERKQILYLLGPVGGGKSSLAERLKSLIEEEPIYVLKAGAHPSPIFESPLGLFSRQEQKDILEKRFNIPRWRLTSFMSPWAVKRLEEFGGDIGKFTVAKMFPSRLREICVTKTEPGDENNQDISSLVGKVDIRMLEEHSQKDVDAYSFSGGLNRTTQGLLEFVEMFKAPIKMLHPLLTATQEGSYVGTENIGAIPYQGIIVAHSNESEWTTFKGNKNNEALLDRISTIKVPYCLRQKEEEHIYQKLLNESKLHGCSCAPGTLQMLARFSILTRLKESENSNLFSKLRVYNGEDLRESDPKALPLHEYRDEAGVDEGMMGISTRFAFKTLSEVLNHDPEELAADPVHLMFVLEQKIRREQFSKEKEEKYLAFLKDDLQKDYEHEIGEEIQKAYIESYNEYGQNIFNRYIAYADAWIEEQDFKDPDTGTMWDREQLERELSKIEKPAGIANPKDFRNEIVKFSLRTGHAGDEARWDAYEKMREVIQAYMFSQAGDLLPVISFEAKKDEDTAKKHRGFVERMCGLGYTERQVRRLVDWYIRVYKAA